MTNLTRDHKPAPDRLLTPAGGLVLAGLAAALMWVAPLWAVFA